MKIEGRVVLENLILDDDPCPHKRFETLSFLCIERRRENYECDLLLPEENFNKYICFSNAITRSYLSIHAE